jgi:hypothetical protein
MSFALFAWPKQAEFNRVLPKSKIYEHARPSRSIRDQFVEEVDQIVWKYKLSPETVNLPSRPGVPEIEVFSVSLRTRELSESILRTIDKAIPFPILFELSHDGQIKSTAAFKRPSDADVAKWVVDAYFETPWQPAEHPREPLPVALDLLGLYEQLLRRQLALEARPGESLKAFVERSNHIQRKKNECSKLETRLQQEKQFNRRVELNRELRRLRSELDSLMGVSDMKELDVTWTN